MLETHNPRIVGTSGSARHPLFDTAPAGTPSPSRTLLIETHTGLEGSVQRRAIPEQVLTLFVEPGRVEHTGENRLPAVMPIPAGTVVLSLRNQLETVRWLKTAQVTSVRVADQVLGEAAAALGRAPRPELAPSHGVNDTRLTSLMHLLHVEQMNGFPAGALFVDGVEQALAALLVSRFAQLPRSHQTPSGGLPHVRARRTSDFIAAHLAEPLRLNELAACAGYSPSHFTLLFCRTFGITPHVYVQRARIDRAKQLLKRNDSAIVEIALSCGFQTQQHFSRVFRAQTGRSPAAYRRTQSE